VLCCDFFLLRGAPVVRNDGVGGVTGATCAGPRPWPLREEGADTVRELPEVFLMETFLIFMQILNNKVVWQ
ncbi:unnamed protein product, partial [Urochloa humidicola]